MTIEKTMTIGDVADIGDAVVNILASYGMHCTSCPFGRMESLEMAARGHGVDPDELVQKINETLSES